MARQITIDLTLCGVDVWLDEWEIRLGQSLPDILADAMAKSRYIGILMTDHYNTSVWTKTEYKKALIREQNEGRVVMLPVLLSGDTIPDFIQDKVYLDLRTDYFGGIARLVGVIYDVPESRITRAVAARSPTCLAEVWETLESVGLEPYALLEREDFNEILRSDGRIADGTPSSLTPPDYARFNPDKVLHDPSVSEDIKFLIRRLVQRGSSTPSHEPGGPLSNIRMKPLGSAAHTNAAMSSSVIKS